MRTTALVLLASSFFLTNARSQPYQISTIAGTTRLLDGGLATAAPLREPVAVALDASGNLYIADESGRILEITTAKALYTLAGSLNTTGYVDGAGTAAQFNTPLGVTVDAQGIVYVGDFYNNVIRKIVVKLQ